MSSPHYSPFTKRLQAKLDEAGFAKATLADASAVQRAFVEALKEEVEARFGPETQPADPLAFTPLVIAGLGSFKMRTRPARKFNVPATPGNPIEKGASRRLVFTAKWEEIK